jgi:hypothetical protein
MVGPGKRRRVPSRTSPGGPVNTRTIAIIALVIAVIIVLALFVF